MAEEQREQVIDEEPEKLSGEGEPTGAFDGQRNPLAPTRLAQETRKWRDRHMIPDSVRSLG